MLFYNSQSYGEFIINVSDYQNINILIRVLENSESSKKSINDYLDNMVEDFYVSDFVPYGKQFYNLSEAYEATIISKDDLEKIKKIHNK